MDDLELLQLNAENLTSKIKHYLITMKGRVAQEATLQEIYSALCFALKEEIMMHWTASTHTYIKKNCRILYYLSLEYLPGRLLANNINNMSAGPLLKQVAQKLGRSLQGILDCEQDPGLGNGGLGRLASCFLDSFATHHFPAYAYGLRYQYGIFEQEIWNGKQIERPDCWLLYENPWELRSDSNACTIRFNGSASTQALIHPEDLENLELKEFEEVRALPYDLPVVGYCKDPAFTVSTLRLWSTKESPRNFRLQRFNAGQLDEAFENSMLTDVLYPNDNHEVGKRIRLKQEYLLVSASLQDIIRQYLSSHVNFSAFPDKVRIQINDTHPALIIPELIWTLSKEYKVKFEEAFEMAQTVTSYTNHTVLKEALEEWNETRLKILLPCQYRVIQFLNQRFCNLVRERYPSDEEKIRRVSIIEGGQVRMANLAIIGSHRINGVAELHTEILKHIVFRDFYELFPERFINITNGITQRRWILTCNKELSEFLVERIGNEWIYDFLEIQKLENFATDKASQEAFLAIKRKKKEDLIEFLKFQNKLRDDTGNLIDLVHGISPDSLFVVHIKRIHEYKRQLMHILYIIYEYLQILDNPNQEYCPKTFIFSGKAAAGYEIAKQILQFIYAVARKINQDPVTNHFIKIVIIENYNVSKAEAIIPAADLSVQIPTAGFEASGTGNMKLTVNGALTIGTSDGANLEMHRSIGDKYWPFSFGLMSHEVQQILSKRSYNPTTFIDEHPKIKRAVETLKNRTFAQGEEEHQTFNYLYYHLVEGAEDIADRYFVLKDLESYIHAHKKVEALYKQKDLWAEYVLMNMAGMGKFSVDEAVKKYASEIWHLRPYPIDPEIMSRVTKEYSLHDRCRIL